MEQIDEQSAVIALAALAQEHRLSIFRLLVRHAPTGLVAGEIASAIGIGTTSTSFHLKELDRAGLIRSKREGRYIRYSVEIAGIRGLLAFLTEDCCQGRPELCGQAAANNTRLKAGACG